MPLIKYAGVAFSSFLSNHEKIPQTLHFSLGRLSNLSTVVGLAGSAINTVATGGTSISPNERLALSRTLEEGLVDLVDSRVLAIVPCVLQDLALDFRVGPACDCVRK